MIVYVLRMSLGNDAASRAAFSVPGSPPGSLTTTSALLPVPMRVSAMPSVPRPGRPGGSSTTVMREHSYFWSPCGASAPRRSFICSLHGDQPSESVRYSPSGGTGCGPASVLWSTGWFSSPLTAITGRLEGPALHAVSTLTASRAKAAPRTDSLTLVHTPGS